MTKILIDRSVVEQALEALKSVLCDPEGNVCWHGSYADRDIIGDALDVFNAALAEQPAESLDGKLVMGLAVIRELTGTQKTDNIEATIEAVRKAVAPQPAKPEALTEEAIDKLDCIPNVPGIHFGDVVDFARAIERAHGIGEQP